MSEMDLDIINEYLHAEELAVLNTEGLSVAYKRGALFAIRMLQRKYSSPIRCTLIEKSAKACCAGGGSAVGCEDVFQSFQSFLKVLKSL